MKVKGCLGELKGLLVNTVCRICCCGEAQQSSAREIKGDVEAKLSSALSADKVPPPEAEEEPTPEAIEAAMNSGRIAEALRTLARLEAMDPEGASKLDSSLVHCIRRVGERYEASMPALQMDESNGKWIKEQLSDGIEYGYRFYKDECHLVSTVDYEDTEILRALAGMCEVDLCSGYKTNVQSANALDDSNPMESVWQIFQNGMLSGKPEDNIVQVSVVDALEEDLGSLWVSVYAVNSEACKVTMPPCKKGASRFTVGSSTACMRPNKSDGSRGFRMTMSLCTPAYATVKMMPTFVLKGFMRKGAQDMTSKFQKHINECSELEKRIQDSSRADFYKSIKEHLAGAKLNNQRTKSYQSELDSDKPFGSSVSTKARKQGNQENGVLEQMKDTCQNIVAFSSCCQCNASVEHELKFQD